MRKITLLLASVSFLLGSCAANDSTFFNTYEKSYGKSIGNSGVQGNFCQPGHALKGYC